MSVPNFASIIEAIRHWAQETPAANALIFLDGEGKTTSSATYADLWRDVRCMALAWQQCNVNPGDVVLLNIGHTYEIVLGFLGAMYVGAAPIILPYPRPGAHDANIERLDLVFRHTDAVAALFPPALATVARERLPHRRSQIHGFAPAAVGDVPAGFEPHVRGSDDPLYMQLTSGTTGRPKIAVLSQAAVMTNIRGVFAARYQPGDTVAGCMPFHHDGGLVLCLLIPLAMGLASVHIDPAHWINEPRLLWQAVNDYKGAVTFLPNFALKFMVRRITAPRPGDFSLESLHTVIVAAEIVTEQSLLAFHQHFVALGLKASALCGGYGMAEQVVGVAFSRTGAPVRIDRLDQKRLSADGGAVPAAGADGGVLAVVGCGAPIAGTKVRIVDEGRRILPERTAGEVQVWSNHCFAGYLGQPELTQLAMDDGWYCTGDLGYLADDELYILGRKDDLIIVGGQNIQPQAIEEIAANALGNDGRLTVAFGLFDEGLGTQRPVLVCEVRDAVSETQLARWRSEIMQRVALQLEIALADLRFVPKGWVLQSDAKIGRKANREKYLAIDRGPNDATIESVTAAHDDPARLASALGALTAELFGVPSVTMQDNLFTLGGDSLTVLRMILTAERATGREVSLDFYRDPTIAHLALLLSNSGDGRQEVASPDKCTDVMPSSGESTEGAPAHRARPLQPERHGARNSHVAPRMRLRNYIERRIMQLTYFDAMWWLLRWHGLGWVQRSFYASESDMLHDFAQSMGSHRRLGRSDIQSHLVGTLILERWLAEMAGDGQDASMLSPPVVGLRSATQSHPHSERWQRYFAVTGAEHIETGLRSGNGLILVGPHTTAVTSHDAYLHLCTPGFAPIANDSYREALIEMGVDAAQADDASIKSARTAVASKAQRLLARNGVVLMAGDQENPVHGQRVTVGNRIHHLTKGFAELAASTGAHVLPFYTELLHDGRHCLNIQPALAADRTGGSGAQAGQITAAFADFMTRLWREKPALMPGQHMKQHLELPKVDPCQP